MMNTCTIQLQLCCGGFFLGCIHVSSSTPLPHTSIRRTFLEQCLHQVHCPHIPSGSLGQGAVLCAQAFATAAPTGRGLQWVTSHAQSPSNAAFILAPYLFAVGRDDTDVAG